MSLPLIVGISGATGVIYGIEVLKVLHKLGNPAHLILSETAVRNFAIESDYSADDVRKLAAEVYSNKDLAAAVSTLTP